MCYGCSFGSSINCGIYSNIDISLSGKYNSLNVFHKHEG